jgi:hypothetical protein
MPEAKAVPGVPLAVSETRPILETESKGILDISGVFRGRELTRLERRVRCGIAPVDKLIGGGIVRGRISEIIGHPGAGRTSLDVPDTPGQDFQLHLQHLATEGNGWKGVISRSEIRLDEASYFTVRRVDADLINVPEAPVNTTAKVP